MHLAYGVIAYRYQYMSIDDIIRPRPEQRRSWREILKCIMARLRFVLDRNQGVEESGA
jgi:hypothetical protein